MSKKTEHDEDFIYEIEDTANTLVNIPPSMIAAFGQYTNPYENAEFREAYPEFVEGRSLIGQLIAIHEVSVEESFALKTSFYACLIEIAGSPQKHLTAFFSKPTKKFFEALDTVGVKYPIVVGVVQLGASYGFQDARTFLANRGIK